MPSGNQLPVAEAKEKLVVNDRFPPGAPTPADSGPPLSYPSLTTDEGVLADTGYDATHAATDAYGFAYAPGTTDAFPVADPSQAAWATDGHGTPYAAFGHEALSPDTTHDGPAPSGALDTGAGQTGWATDGHGVPGTTSGYDTGAGPLGAPAHGTHDPGYDYGGYGGGVDGTEMWATDTSGAGTHDTGAYPTGGYGTGVHDTGMYASSSYGAGAYPGGYGDTGTYDTGGWQAATHAFVPHQPGPALDESVPANAPLGQWSSDGADTGGWTPGWDSGDWHTQSHTTYGSGLPTGLTDTGLLGYHDPLTDPALTDPLAATGPHLDATTGFSPAPDGPDTPGAADLGVSGYEATGAETTGPTVPDGVPGPLDDASAGYGPTSPDDAPAGVETAPFAQVPPPDADPAPEAGPDLAATVPGAAHVAEGDAAPVGPEPSSDGAPSTDPSSRSLPPRTRRRAAPRARRSAMLTVAMPSAAVMGMAVVAAASVHDVGSDGEDGGVQAASDLSSTTPVKVNNKLDTQLDGLTQKAGNFADRASRTQERIDLKKRQEAERKRKEAEAARREAMRPKYALPVQQHGLSAYYGQAGANWMSLHTGIDFPVSYGTPVMAATDGTVRTQWNPSYGNMVIVTAPDGTETWYCHLSSAKIRSGSVKAGDVIAYSGNSGKSTGPHLHFEVRPGGGDAIDPLAWLRGHGLDPT